MNHLNTLKKQFTVFGGILALALIILACVFGRHCYEVNRYNAALHTISSSGEDKNNISIDLHPRGQSTDKWDKQDEVLGTTIKGIIYEATVTNNSDYELNDWTLRLNFGADGFVNNAWCGTVELHQRLSPDQDEQTQELDLRNYDPDTVTLDHHISGNDLLITVAPGSSLIYHPSTTDGEQPLDPHGSVNIGIILYSYTDSVSFSSFSMEYHLHKDYIDSDSMVYFLAFTIWLLCLLVFITMAVMTARYERRLQESDKLISESLDVFSNFVDAKDPYTKGHSGRVAEYSRMIAEKLGFSEERCRQVYYIALLHDIGKCYVPDEILKKPSRLTDEEFNIIKTHTTHGAEMVKNFSSIPDIRDGALYHHERYDGKGYPTGKSGEDIPLIARIICVADSYDAMNSSRVYRKKLSRDVIISEIENNRGTQFDPKLADIFLELLKDMPEEA